MASRRPSARERADAASKPEHWSVEIGGGDVAQLDIPAHATRQRTFEIDCRLVVMHRDAGPASHALRVLVDGAQEWSRRVPTHNGAHDSLDFHLRRRVPVGRPLRITAMAEAEGATRVSLSISAEEDAA
jgi:hypothetical protein